MPLVSFWLVVAIGVKARAKDILIGSFKWLLRVMVCPIGILGLLEKRENVSLKIN
ncbi:hypothetical protein AM1_0241 [Acaryochloris marina MBIC11017]|uniref:Uncharacterized protein n=1 Tax=Acaryochloris marina (strain MBIC 11017) TaxID=329726 RepID=B0C8T7_ACAM1|nr:hypothetical protein AM1_0241 [Acaryochloris marina MBIC11017]